LRNTTAQNGSGLHVIFKDLHLMVFLNVTDIYTDSKQNIYFNY